MGIKTLIFLGLFALCSVGALVAPSLGVLGYVAHYVIGPEGQWWTRPLRPYDLRYAQVLAGATALGFALHYRKLRFGRRWLLPQEWLMAAFLALVWLMSLISPSTDGYTIVDHPAIKMSKVMLFCFLLTHIMTDVRRLRALSLVLILGTWVLGMQAYAAPRWMFMHGRLEGIGGPDFSESNFLPAFVGAVLPIIGLWFLRKGLFAKGLSILSGVFAVNAIILTRSRGALLALLAGALAAVVFCPRRIRGPVLLGMCVAVVGASTLVDTGFLDRVATIQRQQSEDERDKSSQGRIDTWQATLRMAAANPLGVGPGNFSQSIGNFDARYAGRDAHNTFVRCLGELGYIGAAMLVALAFNALASLRKTLLRLQRIDDPAAAELVMLSYGFLIGTVTALVCGLMVTLLYTELLWWLFAIPVCLRRATDNLVEDRARREELVAAQETSHAAYAREALVAAGEGNREHELAGAVGR